METLHTERLIIRDFKETDGQDLYEYLSDEEVVKFEPYKPFSLDAAKEEAIRRSTDPHFAAVVLNDGKLIGNLYFCKEEFDTWEIGYVFNKNYWKHGYATESATELMKYLFEKENARRIIAMCDPLNPNSWGLLERLGLRREAHFHENVYFFKDENDNPIWKDTYVYSILKTEWMKKQA